MLHASLLAARMISSVPFADTVDPLLVDKLVLCCRKSPAVAKGARDVHSSESLSRRLLTKAGHDVKAIRFHERTLYSSTEIRERMLRDESREKLVPKSVVAAIKEIAPPLQMH